MNGNKKIDVMKSVYARNAELASELNKKLTGRAIFCVNVMGSPGAGKTSALIKIIERLGCPAFVIEGDIESGIDAEKLGMLGIKAVQINTGGACHLDAPSVAEVFFNAGSGFGNGFLFIENIGNLVCPAEFMIGEHIKLLVCSVTDGGDKPYKYPLAFEKADIVLLNKCDLRDRVDFDRDFFMAGIKKLNPSVPVFEISCATGSGVREAVRWLTEKAARVIE